jgi:Flp pilus assembly protein TadG
MRRAVSIFLKRFGRDPLAATASEFALVVPLLVLFLLGIIDVGRLMYEWNLAEKSTQMGVRYAVVTDIVPTGLINYDFTLAGVTQGSPVNSTIFPGVSCTGTASTATCTCKGTCAFPLTGSSAAFNNIVTRLKLMDSRIAHANVVVDYDPSGLGFAGNPHGPDVAPIVTVSLRDMEFTPIMGQIFGATVDMPGFASSLTMEDGSGTVSN